MEMTAMLEMGRRGEKEMREGETEHAASEQQAVRGDKKKEEERADLR
jgi:hypothetical protein